MTKAEFQNAHGADWAGITKNPAFFAAMQLSSVTKLQNISMLSDDQIKEHGPNILADFRGHLQLENFLLDLAVESELPFTDLPEESYTDPNRVDQAFTAEPVEPASNHNFVHFQQPKKTKKPAKKPK